MFLKKDLAECAQKVSTFHQKDVHFELEEK
jgi:hypothetical protein